MYPYKTCIRHLFKMFLDCQIKCSTYQRRSSPTQGCRANGRWRNRRKRRQRRGGRRRWRSRSWYHINFTKLHPLHPFKTVPSCINTIPMMFAFIPALHEWCWKICISCCSAFSCFSRSDWNWHPLKLISSFGTVNVCWRKIWAVGWLWNHYSSVYY